ncbi:MAG: coniferyl-alcohol dehydrogenase [Cytophagales bacterium]|nr:coniferyl-alcohol dehydrogenase [Rhizobacter sp.]
MLSSKTILITGVSSGIGAETARLAQARGAHVIGVDRVAPTFAVDTFHLTDLSDPQAIAALVKDLPSGISALANVAGLPGTAGAHKVAAVNYLGLRHLTESLATKLAPEGSIVHLASIAGAAWSERLSLHKELAHSDSFEAGAEWLARHPVADDFSYPYFKEALLVWSAMRSAHWWRERGIRMNCVSPGPVETPILADFRASLGDARVQGDIDRVGRAGTPADVAVVVLFLCSDDARWINGANIATDGGLAASFL